MCYYYIKKKKRKKKENDIQNLDNDIQNLNNNIKNLYYNINLYFGKNHKVIKCNKNNTIKQVKTLITNQFLIKIKFKNNSPEYALPLSLLDKINIRIDKCLYYSDNITLQDIFLESDQINIYITHNYIFFNLINEIINIKKNIDNSLLKEINTYIDYHNYHDDLSQINCVTIFDIFKPIQLNIKNSVYKTSIKIIFNSNLELK